MIYVSQYVGMGYITLQSLFKLDARVMFFSVNMFFPL